MKNLFMISLFVVAAVAWSQSSFSEDAHDEQGAADEHKEGEKDHSEGDSHDHGKEEKGHGGEEASDKVGPGKGVSEKGPLGFKLSPEAQKTIGFQTMPYDSTTNSVACSTIVHVKNDKFVFRSRNGWLKKEPVESLSRNGSLCAVRFSNLQPGDLIVTTQLGFLRIAEVFLEEGASHSHSH